MNAKSKILLLLAAAVLALQFLPADSAHSQEKTPAAAPAPAQPAAPPAEKILLASPEEFKSYLDAEKQAIAREREALLALRTQVRQEVEKLQSLQRQIDEKFAKEDAGQDERIKKMVKIFSTMRPDEVGPLLARLDEDLAIRVLFDMKPKTQADLLARMPPDKAAAISKKIMSKDFK
jgi:flagellar motility protein MotE (MotC chaperone)